VPLPGHIAGIPEIVFGLPFSSQVGIVARRPVMPDGIIRVYGTTWCPDMAKARRILDKNHICFA